jgi:hypothetical protein
MAARVLHETKFFKQLKKNFTQGIILRSLVEICQVVLERRFSKILLTDNKQHTKLRGYTGQD